MAPKEKRKKATNTRKPSNKMVIKKNNSPKESGALHDEIILVIALAVSVLLFLSNFNLIGVFGNFVSNMAFGLIGVEAYILPLIVFFTTAFHLSNAGNRRAGRKILSAFVFFVALASLIQLITGIQELSNYNILNYYKASSENHSGGGIIGGIFAKLLYELFGEVGAYIILIALMLISIIVITGKAILSYIAGKGKNAIKEHSRQQKLRREQSEDTEYDNAYENQLKALPRKRTAKTFVIDKTTPSTLAGENNIDVIPVANKQNKKSGNNRTAKDDELPILNFNRLFEDEPDEHDADNVVNINTYEKSTGKVITYEDELRAKFGRPNAEAVEPSADIHGAEDAHAEHETTPVEDKKEKKIEGSDKIEELNISSNTQQKEYVFPPLNLLTAAKNKGSKGGLTEKDLKDTAMKLQSTLESFGVHVTVTNASIGPAVTRYELQPEQGVRVNEITRLADDIKLNLAASEIRIEAPIPGKAAVGIEVPNKENTVVTLREIIECKEFTSHSSKLAFAVGKDIGGQPIVADISKMPHVLIAGATGSGKSVCINTLIMSILYKSSPADVKMIMVDPKVVELSVYNGIPHLLIPVVTDPKKAAAALNWAVAEMTERYKKFADLNVKDIKGYNDKVAEVAHLNDENYQKMPQIVIIIDELADLMMVAQNEVEDAICRLAQLARAAGLHLVIATQRPSVNVITGLIKANIPSRIAFAVSSQVDSRTIIDGAGAEKLLGKGDMLFFPAGLPKPIRVQGAFINDKEVNAVVDFLKKNNSEASYSEEIHEKISNARPGDGFLGGGSNERDEYFAEAGKFIIEKDKASIGMLQRVYKIGFNRAARIMDQLAEAGVVGPEEGTKPRKILMSLEEFEQYLEEN